MGAFKLAKQIDAKIIPMAIISFISLILKQRLKGYKSV
jgi:hypothetical protein